MAFGDTGILDNFNRANEGPPPSADWTDIANGLEVFSNQVRGDSLSVYNWSCWDTSTFGADCEAYFTMVDTPGTGACGVSLRCTTLLEASIDGYLAWYTHGGGVGSETRVYEILNGGFTQIGSGDAFAGANGDKIGGEIIGTTIKVYVDDGGAGWAVNSTETDNTYGSAGYIGLRYFSNSYDADDFGGGTLAVGPTAKSVSGALSISGALARKVKFKRSVAGAL